MGDLGGFEELVVEVERVWSKGRRLELGGCERLKRDRRGLGDRSGCRDRVESKRHSWKRGILRERESVSDRLGHLREWRPIELVGDWIRCER